jgi:single-strand DNA-binding protein
MSFSQVILIGHLGVDPELKYTKNNKPLLNLSVGVAQRLSSNTPKDIKPKTFWHKCRRWGERAQTDQTMLKKGDKVFIKGNLVYDTWEDKAGRSHKDAVVEIEFLEKMYYENITIDLNG